MSKILSILLFSIVSIAAGQKVQIDTFKLKKSEQYKDLQSNKMNFPIIRSGNAKIDSLINTDSKNRFSSYEYPNEPFDSTLIKWAGDQIVYLDFKVTFNQQGILSFNVSAEGCGAHCTYATDYFNYSTTSGEWLIISDIMDTTGVFKEKVYDNKQRQYQQQKQELKELLNDPESGLDETSYEWVLEYYQDCENSFNLETFAVYPDRLEIIENCYLPNAIKNMMPFISLIYRNSEIEKYLKI